MPPLGQNVEKNHVPTRDDGSMPAPALRVSDVTHRYGSLLALHHLTLEVPRGRWALLGPNGAGKTTLIRLALGLTRATTGEVSVLGLDPTHAPSEVRRRIGYMPESAALLPGLTGVQYVVLASRLNGIPPAEARRGAHTALDSVGLGEARYRLVESYSTGMRQRVKLAQALAHDPELLILDEPTNGLDPDGRDAMLGLINDLTQDGGHALLFASHILHEVRQVADHAAILAQGRTVHVGPLGGLEVNLGGYLLEPIDDPTPLLAALGAAGHAHRRVGDAILVEEAEGLPELLALADQAGVALRAARPHQRGVQDVVVGLMEGHEGRAEEGTA